MALVRVSVDTRPLCIGCGLEILPRQIQASKKILSMLLQRTLHGLAGERVLALGESTGD